MRVRTRLKVAMLESGRPQREYARACNIAEPRLSSIVRGWVDPRADERGALARTLGATEQALFPEEPVQLTLPISDHEDQDIRP